MGCYLGNQIFRTSDITASIVCNGRKDVECTEFPADQGNYTVYLLETNSNEVPFGGSTVYLEFFNGSTWVQMSKYDMPGVIGPGYAWVSFGITPNGWVGQMRLRYDGGYCIKGWTQYKSTHSECGTDGVCRSVAGRGIDLCTDSVQCSHKECGTDGVCRIVIGPGIDTCIEDLDCQHLECRNNNCQWVPGVGPHQCSGLGEGVCYHTECRDGSCWKVGGPGIMACTDNSQCIICNDPICSLTII